MILGVWGIQMIKINANTLASEQQKYKGAKIHEIVEGLIDDNTFGGIVGGSKTRKSFLAQQLAVSLVSGKPFLGMYKITPTRPERVLYVNLEFQTRAFNIRYENIIKSMDVDKKCLKNIYHTRTISDDMSFVDEKTKDVRKEVKQGLKDYIVKNKITTLIIDPFYMLGGFEEVDNTQVGNIVRFFQYLRRITKIKIVMVSHTTKSPSKADWQNIWGLPRGASALGNNFEWIMAIRPNEDNNELAGLYCDARHIVHDRGNEPINLRWNTALAIWEQSDATNVYTDMLKMFGERWDMPAKEFKEKCIDILGIKPYKITPAFINASNSLKWKKGYGKDRTAIISRINHNDG